MYIVVEKGIRIGKIYRGGIYAICSMGSIALKRSICLSARLGVAGQAGQQLAEERDGEKGVR